MSKDRRLGRGLAALLGDGGEPTADSTDHPTPRLHAPNGEETGQPVNASSEGSPSTDLLLLAVGEIDDNPFQPRREFGESELASLAESLKEHDMLQPILVRRVDHRWQLISGERRLRAAVRAGWTQVPARVRQADDRLVAELAIVENLQRKDLNPLEKALSFQRYLEQHRCTQEELGQRLKINRSTIANLVRLLELPDTVQDALRQGSISAGHARALLPLGEDRAQTDFCDRIRGEGISVRETERLVQEQIAQEDGERLPVAEGPGEKPPARSGSQQIVSLEKDLRLALGTKVEVRQGSRKRGKVIVHFANADEFQRLYDTFTQSDPSQRRSEAI